MANSGGDGDHGLNQLIEAFESISEKIVLESGWDPGLMENIRVRARARLTEVISLETTVPGAEFTFAVKRAILESYREQTPQDWDTIVLWERGKRSYPDAMDDLHRRYRNLVMARLRGSGVEDLNLEDLSQEVWIRVNDNIQKVRGPELRSYEGWLATIATNVARDAHRRKEHSALDQADHGHEDPESSLSVEEFFELQCAESPAAVRHPEVEMNFYLDLRRYYNRWTLQEQRMFDLCVAGYTQTEIARMVGLSQSTVNGHLKKIFLQTEQLLKSIKEDRNAAINGTNR